jgi:energy-coupling factor transporter ATP-binding protein EcfA2
VFARLFPGGEGRLLLTDPGNMLTTGLEVEARPPGKKIKRLSLLSGGERSLVAVALLVAIFKARPSPFYIMDEVEAALDDANLGRLLTLFEELRDSSQLIVITHQKKTMEIADALYGVTMRGDGVTTVVSQRMRDAVLVIAVLVVGGLLALLSRGAHPTRRGRLGGGRGHPARRRPRRRGRRPSSSTWPSRTTKVKLSRAPRDEATVRGWLRGRRPARPGRPEMDRRSPRSGSRDRPAVVLVVGVNGTGKTTTVGKLARVLVAEDRDVVLGAADTFRAAAADQLQTWGERVGVPTIRSDRDGADPAAVAFDAVKAGGRDRGRRRLIDTAGRLHNKVGLMDELGKVKRVIEKQSPIDEVLLVLDATTGRTACVRPRSSPRSSTSPASS